MPIIIPDYTSYVGSNLTKLSIKAPYSLQHDIDSSIEESGLGGELIANAAITNAKIANLAVEDANINNVDASKIIADTLSAITALLGTVYVGGSGNGNGILNVRDASNNNKVVLNNAGITVYDGKIVIQNAGGNTTIDENGIVSAQNFSFSSVTNSSSQTINTGSWQDLTSMSLSFSLSRASRILLMGTATGGNNTLSGDTLGLRLVLDGSQVGGFSWISGVEYGGGILYSSGSIITIESVASGNHTIKLQ